MIFPQSRYYPLSQIINYPVINASALRQTLFFLLSKYHLHTVDGKTKKNNCNLSILQETQLNFWFKMHLICHIMLTMRSRDTPLWHIIDSHFNSSVVVLIQIGHFSIYAPLPVQRRYTRGLIHISTYIWCVKSTYRWSYAISLEYV